MHKIHLNSQFNVRAKTFKIPKHSSGDLVPYRVYMVGVTWPQACKSVLASFFLN